MILSGLGLGLSLVVAATAAPIATAAASQATNVRSRASSQCLPGETVLYSCRFGGSLGSVCAAGTSVHYRFGPPLRPDIDLASAADWGNVHVGRVVGQAGGHQSHVRFTSGHHHYIVYEGVDGEAALSPGRRYSGIHVAAGPDGGESVSDLRCRGDEMMADDLSTSVAASAPEELRTGDVLWEQRDGPFDAWF